MPTSSKSPKNIPGTKEYINHRKKANDHFKKIIVFEMSGKTVLMIWSFMKIFKIKMIGTNNSLIVNNWNSILKSEEIAIKTPVLQNLRWRKNIGQVLADIAFSDGTKYVIRLEDLIMGKKVYDLTEGDVKNWYFLILKAFPVLNML